MAWKQIRMQKAQIQQGACCDKSMGPKVIQLTVQDEETGKKYYCNLSRDNSGEEFLVANRDVLHKIANLYDEDVIPFRLERYRLAVPEEREALAQSAFYDCWKVLEREMAAD